MTTMKQQLLLLLGVLVVGQVSGQGQWGPANQYDAMQCVMGMPKADCEKGKILSDCKKSCQFAAKNEEKGISEDQCEPATCMNYADKATCEANRLGADGKCLWKEEGGGCVNEDCPHFADEAACKGKKVQNWGVEENCLFHKERGCVEEDCIIVGQDKDTCKEGIGSTKCHWAKMGKDNHGCVSKMACWDYSDKDHCEKDEHKSLRDTKDARECQWEEGASTCLVKEPEKEKPSKECEKIMEDLMKSVSDAQECKGNVEMRGRQVQKMNTKACWMKIKPEFTKAKKECPKSLEAPKDVPTKSACYKKPGEGDDNYISAMAFPSAFTAPEEVSVDEAVRGIRVLGLLPLLALAYFR